MPDSQLPPNPSSLGNDPEKPLVLAFVSDLYFVSRIEVAADHFGAELEFTADMVGGIPVMGTDSPKPALGEAADAFDRKAALVLVDLNQAGSVKWIAEFRAKRAEAVPIIAFGSHVETEKLNAARLAGADKAVARSRFVEILPSLFEELNSE